MERRRRFEKAREEHSVDNPEVTVISFKYDAHHGYNSRQANEERRELNRLYERCERRDRDRDRDEYRSYYRDRD